MQNKQTKNWLNRVVLLSFLAMAGTSLTEAFASDVTDIAQDNTGSSSGGCYATYEIQCPKGPLGVDLGTRLVCSFTGVYGAPYGCTETKCGNHDDDIKRHCVKADTPQ